MAGRLARGAAICIFASLVVPVASAPPAGAAAKAITGKLTQSGFSVIGLAEDGKARVAEAKGGTFRLKPPARRVTLHLRAADGTYAGPIVIDRDGKRAIVGVEAGTDLGRIKVRDGYGKVVHPPDEDQVDAKRYARANKKGIPIGVGTFGRVRVKPGGKVPGDTDRDGVPDPLDIDNDGDLIIDNLDPSPAGRGRTLTPIGGCGPNNVFCPIVASALTPARIEDTVNVSAGSTPADIDEAQVSFANLRFVIFPGDAAELDCGDPDTGLSYCRKNGSTGVVFNTAKPPFPGCCDADGDGFGTLDPALNCPGCGADSFFIAPRATSAAIGSGDVLVEHVSTGVPESECPPPQGESNPGCESFPATINYVFATTPAMVSYSDETGNTATLSYPVGDLQPGTEANGFPVDDGPEDPDSDVEVTLTFYRPQRPALPGSDPPGIQYMDMGHLTHGAIDTANANSPCPQSAYSTTDPSLTASTIQPFLPGFTDLRDDLPSSPANTFSYTLNLSQCHPGFGSGDKLNIVFQARVTAPDFAQQSVWFEHV